jgi:hypothetical protein
MGMVQMNGFTRVVDCHPNTHQYHHTHRTGKGGFDKSKTEKLQQRKNRFSAYLIVGGAETSANALVVQNLHLEREILFQLHTNTPKLIPRKSGRTGKNRTFLMIITKKGNLIPSVFFGSAGQVT